LKLQLFKKICSKKSLDETFSYNNSAKGGAKLPLKALSRGRWNRLSFGGEKLENQKNTLKTVTVKSVKQLCRNAHINELDNSRHGRKLSNHEFFRIRIKL